MTQKQKAIQTKANMDTRHTYSRLSLELPQLGAALAAEVRLHVLDTVTVHVHRHAAPITVDNVLVVVFVCGTVKANHANLQKACVTRGGRKEGRKEGTTGTQKGRKECTQYSIRTERRFPLQDLTEY